MAQQPMTQFWPIFASRSDGVQMVNQKNKPLRNGPTEEQLNKKPNDQGQADYYRLIERDDPKHVDWRKKLGGMLLREVGGKQHEDKWQQCVLWNLPENYVLYEHIKTKADGQVKTVKNHSGGGHDRQDAYLYGYPKGPKKRFRSPVEFFPHLLWLCSDESGDRDNCTCKMCSPGGDVEKPAVKIEVKAEQPLLVKPEPGIGAPLKSNPPVGRSPVVQTPAQRLSTGPVVQGPGAKPPTPVSAPVPGPNATQIRAPQPPQSTPLPQPRSLEQQADVSYNKFLCRTGEVVWFYRPETSAWGLGLVIRRWATKDNPPRRSYLVQPLSHPFDHPRPELIDTDEHVKPWLAWSAPACTFAFLQQNPQLSYGQVDWKKLESGQFGDGIATVDASIMAAKAIDNTYTLCELLKTTTEAGHELRHHNAIYLGAEKIWRGEAVRLRIGSGSDLMVVTDILERVVNTGSQNQSVSQVLVIGDIYSYATMEAPDANNPPKPPQNNTNIPTRMTLDMMWRNRLLVPITRTAAWWKLIAGASKLDISDIKGRWYETSLVFQEPFTKAVKNNEGGNGIWMNSRGDATGVGKSAGSARPDRVAAFGQSIPGGTQLVEGVEPPNEQIVPPTQSHESLDIGAGTGGSDAFSLDDFMNVDHLGDESNIQFGQGFNF
ncbi:hypothetical protein ACN47E_001344 [Coniothyrium glycines]